MQILLYILAAFGALMALTLFYFIVVEDIIDTFKKNSRKEKSERLRRAVENKAAHWLFSETEHQQDAINFTIDFLYEQKIIKW